MLSNFPLSFPSSSLHHSYYSKFNSKYTLFSFLCSKEKKLKKNLPRCYISSIIFTIHNYKKRNCQILPREYFLNLHNKTRKSRKRKPKIERTRRASIVRGGDGGMGSSKVDSVSRAKKEKKMLACIFIGNLYGDPRAPYPASKYYCTYD